MGLPDERADRPALLPDGAIRQRAYERLAGLLERHWDEVPGLRVAPAVDDAELDGRLSRFDFAAPVGLERLLDAAGELLRDGIVHTSHPRYFGLFNPTAAPRPASSTRCRRSPTEPDEGVGHVADQDHGSRRDRRGDGHV